jgi:hypothetical protein
LKHAVTAALLLALAGAAAAEEAQQQAPAAQKRSHNLRLGAAYYLCPFEGVGFGAWQVGAAYHYNIADYALVGPAFTYTGLTGEKLLSDLQVYPNKPQNTRLAIHLMKFGAHGYFNPAQKLSKVKYFWPYGGVDLGLAVHYVTDRGNTQTSL